MAQECLLLLFVVFYFLILLSAADGVENCPTFHCGQLGELHFPFTNTSDKPECGLYIKGCDDLKPDGAQQVQLGTEEWYKIMRIFQTEGWNSISVQDPKLEQLLSWQNCAAPDDYLPPPPSPEFSPIISAWTLVMPSLKLFICDKLSGDDAKSFQFLKCKDHRRFYGFVTPGKEDQFKSLCRSVQLPVRSNPNATLVPNSNLYDIYHLLTDEITIMVTLSPDCHKCYYERGGQCGFAGGYFECVGGTTKKDWKRVVIVATVASIAGVAMLVILVCCYKRRVLFRKNENLTHQTIEAFLKYQLYLSTKRYSYSEIKKVTNTFRDKLGKGGYGTVYKGKLPDGRLIAVKVLSDTKGNGEEFINEVASISKTSHVNIVSLLGFCLQGSKRALVYEFMHNGSLEKFLYQESVLMNDHILDCKTLYDIAVGVARGLEYLHRGCNTRILHFDIKPHNILLDEHFCPKISDFGLAKICSRKESIVSMLGTRGTVGYIAPEVFCRNFGGVSHKSDVYSYGMLVLEMFGGRKNMNVEEDCNSQIYFPDWIYKRLELNEELRLGCIKNERDEERVRKVTLVSLWCIQADPSTRPTMSKVVEMLEGRLESLQVPPKPVLSSPPRSPPINSTQTCDTL